MLKGIAASAGISIAKAYKLESPKVEIVKKEGDPAKEVEKFNAALEKTKTDIEGVKERASERLSAEELAVFDAHLMMAGDPEFAAQIIAMIENDKVNAEFAADTAAVPSKHNIASLLPAHHRRPVQPLSLPGWLLSEVDPQKVPAASA